MLAAYCAPSIPPQLVFAYSDLSLSYILSSATVKQFQDHDNQENPQFKVVYPEISKSDC